MVLAQKEACGELPGDEWTKRRHFVRNSVNADAWWEWEMEPLLARRDRNVFLSRDGRVFAVATFRCHNLFSLGTPCFAYLTAIPLSHLSFGGLTYERSAAAAHMHADKRLKVTEKEKDNVNQFSKLGIDWTCRIDVTEFKANGMPAESGPALMNQTR